LLLRLLIRGKQFHLMLREGMDEEELLDKRLSEMRE
jgi:hypothetical protein